MKPTFRPACARNWFGSFFLYNSGFVSPYGFSFGKDLRGQGEARTIFSLSRHDTASFGVTGAHESVTNSLHPPTPSPPPPPPPSLIFHFRLSATRFPSMPRTAMRWRPVCSSAAACALNSSARLRSHDGYTRPFFPQSNISRVNPKLAAAYVAGGGPLHASFGMGLRPPSGFDLAFTDNPRLNPSGHASFDAGVERKFGNLPDARHHVFLQPYYDLIVTLGGSLAGLSHYQFGQPRQLAGTGRGVLGAAAAGPLVLVAGSYTLLELAFCLSMVRATWRRDTSPWDSS